MARRGRPRHPDILTPREWEVLALLREGLTNEQIAERLGVTYHAARFHVGEILSRLGVSTREEAAAWQPPERRRTPGWTRALEGAAALAAIATVGAVAVLALGVFSTSSGEGTTTATPAASSGAPTAPPPGVSPTTTFVPATPPAIGPFVVRDMQLVSPDFGWVLAFPSGCPDFGDECNQPGTAPGGTGRLITLPFSPDGSTGAASARDILPAGLSPFAVRGVHFLDSSHGWLVAGNIVTPEEETQLTVYRTSDGGATWESADLGPPKLGYSTTNAPVFIDFVDARNGWVVAPTRVTVQESLGDLYRTDDGGVTWTQATAVSAHPVYFVNQTDGWAVGNTGLGQTDRLLFFTSDGGDSWAQAQASDDFLPADVSRSHLLPVLTEVGTTLMPSVDTTADGSSVVRLTSLSPSAPDPTRLSTSPSFEGPITATLLKDGEIVGLITSPDGLRILRYGQNGEWSITDAATGTPGVDVVQKVSFIDQQRGWALVSQSGCAQFQADCWQATYILQTEDGGRTWSILHVPWPPPLTPDPRPSTPDPRPSTPDPRPSAPALIHALTPNTSTL